jgi:uridylate kinase
MDMTAFTLCKENNLPIIVFDMNTAGNLERLLNGESLGTLVSMGGNTSRPRNLNTLLDASKPGVLPLVGNQPEQA